jgi:serine/threonine protein kinase
MSLTTPIPKNFVVYKGHPELCPYAVGQLMVDLSSPYFKTGINNRIYRGYIGRDMVAVRICTRPKDKLQTLAHAIEEISNHEKLGDHANIVHYYGWIFINNKYSIVLEYIESDLFDYIDSNDISNDKKEYIAYGILSGLKHLHSKGIIHGDLKLENVLINDNDVPKLCDFDGISYTLLYLSPERLLDNNLTPSADVWAYGILVFVLFRLTLPYGIENIKKRLTNHKFPNISRLPKNIANICTQCFQLINTRATLDDINEIFKSFLKLDSDPVPVPVPVPTYTYMTTRSLSRSKSTPIIVSDV